MSRPIDAFTAGRFGEPHAGALDVIRRRALGGAIYYLSHIARRDPRLWVFGNHKGFRDNPRYLAEHIANEHPEIAAWWVAADAGEADQARSAGLRVVMRATRDGVGIQHQAGVAFLSNAFMDLQAPYLGGAFIVHLFHGTPLKRVLLDMEAMRAEPGSYLARVSRSVHRWSVRRRLRQVDMVAAGGDLARTRFISAFGLPPDRVRALGSPRFDVILGGPAYDRVSRGDLRARLGLKPSDRAVVWLPTWREDGDAGWLPKMRSDEVETLLAGSGVTLLVKIHPYSDIGVYRQRLSEHRSIRLLHEADEDVNCLLRVADALVTDYSSAVFDYALLQRPIHFFAPDAGDYRGGRGLYEPYDHLTGGRHHVAWAPLLAELAASARGGGGDGGPGLEHARRVAGLAGNCGAPGSSERIVRAVADAVGIEARDLGVAGER